MLVAPSPPEPRSPNPIDLQVGARVRLRRKWVNMSQEQLAAGLGITFQQVQKYERGANRISASRLYEIAGVLGVSVSYFFEDLPDPAGAAPDPASAAGRVLNALLESPEGLEMAQAFSRVGQARVRRQVLALVRAVAMADDPDDVGVRNQGGTDRDI